MKRPQCHGVAAKATSYLRWMRKKLLHSGLSCPDAESIERNRWTSAVYSQLSLTHTTTDWQTDWLNARHTQCTEKNLFARASASVDADDIFEPMPPLPPTPSYTACIAENRYLRQQNKRKDCSLDSGKPIKHNLAYQRLPLWWSTVFFFNCFKTIFWFWLWEKRKKNNISLAARQSIWIILHWPVSLENCNSLFCLQ